MTDILPKVTVLLATFNGAAHCEAQLRSILWQTSVDVRVLVRDDGSNDDTMAIVDRMSEEFLDKIEVIVSDRRYGAATGNFFALLRAVDLNACDYVAFADQDDVWLPGKLAKGVSTMQQAGGQGYSSNLIAYDKAGRKAWLLDKHGSDAELDYLFQGASAGCTYVLDSKLARMVREVIAAAPDLCAGASHDWIVYAIARSRGVIWCRDTVAEIVYRQHSANLYGASRGWRDRLTKARLVRSRWYRDHILWLEHVVPGSPNEREIFAALRRGSIADRIWLARQAARFRRTGREASQLRLAILTGLI